MRLCVRLRLCACVCMHACVFDLVIVCVCECVHVFVCVVWASVLFLLKHALRFANLALLFWHISELANASLVAGNHFDADQQFCCSGRCVIF